MRDVRKVKNKLEFRLDSSQVFFLFAGLVTFAAFVFVLGVVVGKGQRAAPAADRLAAALPTATPEHVGVADRLRDREGADRVETIYRLDEGANSIAQAMPSRSAPKPTATPKPTPTAKVAVASATPTVAPSATPPRATAASRYTVQIAAYEKSDQAQAFVEKLRAEGFAAYTVTYQKDSGPTWHRVRVGSFPSKTEAKEMADRVAMRMNGVRPAVMRIE